MNKLKFYSVLLILTLFLSSCSLRISDEDKPGDDISNEIKLEVETPAEPDNAAIPATFYKAKHPVNFDFIQIYDQFMEEHRAAEVWEFELSLKNNAYVYQIEAKVNQEEIEGKYDAASGNLLELDREPLFSKKMIFTREDLSQITSYIDRVMIDAGQGFYLKELVLQEDNGKKVIEIEIINDKSHDIEYKFDMVTQELIEKDQ